MREFDMKHRVDIVTLAVYWYWVVGVLAGALRDTLFHAATGVSLKR